MDELTQKMIQRSNTTFNINGSIQDYIEYEKYKDSTRFKFSDIKPETKRMIMVITIVILFLATIIIAIDMSKPPIPNNFKVTWEGIGMFLAIAAGLGWIIHGTGFLLVRR